MNASHTTQIQTLHETQWPTLLTEANGVSDAPKTLYCRGSVPDWSRTLICIVGARRHSEYGKKVCEKIIDDLASYPVTIVSGLAIGIDAIAHHSALRNKLPTIAVVCSGLDDSSLYPKTNFMLAQEILHSNGTILSEYKAGTTAEKRNFPARNRIMAGMSSITVIIECERVSGTRITARLALEYGREVCAIPHSIFSEVGFGTNELLSEGAHLVQDGNTIADIAGFDKQECTKIEIDDLTENERKILKILQTPKTKTQLTQEVALPMHSIQAALTLLEMKKLIVVSMGMVQAKKLI